MVSCKTTICIKMSCVKGKIRILFLLSCYLLSTTARHEIVSKANNYIGWQLLGHGFGHKEENAVFSPFSLNTVLCLIYQATGQSTAILFNTVLTYGPQRFMADQYRSIMYRVLSIRNVTLNIATNIYLSDQVHFADKFLRVALKKFNTGVEKINFHDKEEAARLINLWVRARTANTIRDVIDPDAFDGNTLMALINVIYFQGKWTEKFDPQLTELRDFHVSKTETVKCQTMFRSGYFDYAKLHHLGTEMLLLPYEDNNVSLVIFLPLANQNLKDLVMGLGGTDLYKLSTELRKTKLLVYLPKFQIERKIYFKKPLIKIGLDSLFDRSGNFENLTPHDNIYVSQVIQKAVIEVNEEGMEAAAATSETITSRTTDPSFTVDHPFIFGLIHHYDETRTLLFLGKIYNPNLN